MRKRKGRAENGRGTLETLPSGKVRLKKLTGGQMLSGPAVRPLPSKSATRKAAEEAWEAKYNPATSSPSISVEWFLRRQIESSALESRETYEYIFNRHILADPIGPILLADLTPAHIQAWKRRISAGRSEGTTRRYLGFLKARLNEAVVLGLIPTNPAAKITLPKVDWDKGFKRVLSPAERTAFLALWTGPMRIAVLLMLHGLRGGEARGIRHEDYDGEGITVNKQVLRRRGKTVVRPRLKNDASRWVPILLPELRDILASKPEGWVLTVDGSPMPTWQYRSLWDRVVKGPIIDKKRCRRKPDHGFTDVTPHDLRSTCAMMLLEAGVDIRTAAEVVGNSPDVLARIYARSRKDLKIEGMRRAMASEPGVSCEAKTGNGSG